MSLRSVSFLILAIVAGLIGIIANSPAIDGFAKGIAGAMFVLFFISRFFIDNRSM